MQSEILKYVNLRVYKNLSTVNLLNAMMCNRVMKKSILVDNSRRIYNLTSKIFGKTFVNAIVNATFCKVFTAGNSLYEADQLSNYFRKQSNIFIISQTFRSSWTIVPKDKLSIKWVRMSWTLMLHCLLSPQKH